MTITASIYIRHTHTHIYTYLSCLSTTTKKKHVTENSIEDYLCCKGTGNYTELCSYICGKQLVGLVNDELGFLAEEISKQSILRVAWFLLAAFSKMQKDRNILNTGFLSKKKGTST